MSRDGLTPISNAGMKSWFRDNLSNYNSLIGTYDSYKEDYNLTLTNNDAFFENLLFDTYVDSGEDASLLSIGSLSRIENPGVSSGTSLQYLYEQPGMYNVVEYENPSNPFDWAPFKTSDYDFQTQVTVTHHAEILAGSLQGYVAGDTAVTTPGTPFVHALFNTWDGGGLPTYIEL